MHNKIFLKYSNKFLLFTLNLLFFKETYYFKKQLFIISTYLYTHLALLEKTPRFSI